MRGGSFVAAALLVVSSWTASCCSSSGGVRWNQAYGNSRNSSYADVITQDAGVPIWTRPLWSNATPGSGRKIPSAPVVGPDGSVFVSWSPYLWHGSGRLVGIHPSGQTKVFDVPTGGVTTTPAIADDGRIFAVVHFGTFVGMQPGTAGPTIPGTLERAVQLSCWDPANGATLWSKPLDYFGKLDEELEASPPKIHGNELFVVTSSPAGSRLYVFDLGGNPIGSFALPGRRMNDDPRPPAIADELPNGREGVVAIVGTALLAAEWIPGQGLGPDSFVVDRTGENWYEGPPVIGSDGHIGARSTSTLEVHATWDPQPSSSCYLPTLVQGIQEPVAFFKDQASAHAYVPGATRLDLVAACKVLNQALVERPSAPVVTKSHVYVSAGDGLHSLSLGLTPASHHVAHVFMNRSPRQPAVGPQGTIYEVVWMNTDQTDMFVLRALGGNAASDGVEP